MAGSLLWRTLITCLKLPYALLSHLRNPYSYFTNSTNKPPTPLTLTPSQYRLDTDSSATFTLPDARKLGYAQYGTATGKTVFYLHGLPGSRLEAAAFDFFSLKLGVRIIAVDRPGYGWSSPHPERTILHHAKDIELLAEHLEVEEYGVLVRIPQLNLLIGSC